MQLRKILKLLKPENGFEANLDRELTQAWGDLTRMLNAGLNFSDNFNCARIDVADTGSANTEFAVAHGLKRVPTDYIVVRRNKAGVVYDSGTTFDVTNIYLKCETANTILTVLIF